MKLSNLLNETEISPSVSIIISTDKSYPKYKTDEKRLQSLMKEVEKELIAEFPKDKANLVIEKLYKLITNLDHKQLSKGLAIFASPEKERIIHLPFYVEEKYIVDSSFEIRDLLYSAKKSIGYLVLLIDSHQPEIYYGYNDVLVKAKTNDLPSGVEDVERDYPSRVSNFSDPNEIKEINLNKYLKEIDNVLTEMLHEIDVPVIICGVKRSIGHFKKLTKNSKNIIDFIEGNYNRNSKEEIGKAIEGTILEKWETDQLKTIESLEYALDKKRCVSGLENVWRAATENRGGLLVVEKDFTCAAKLGDDKFTLVTEDVDFEDSDVIKDAVDDLIELVLKSHGDIAFVNNGRLENHNKIALITYF